MARGVRVEHSSWVGFEGSRDLEQPETPSPSGLGALRAAFSFAGLGIRG